MALSLTDLPLDEWLGIMAGPPVKKLDLAFFGEDENDVPLPPILRFTVRYGGQRCEVVVQVNALEISGQPDNKREYNLTGTLLRRNSAEQWCAVGGAEISSYCPKGNQHHKGSLRLRGSSWVPIRLVWA